MRSKIIFLTVLVFQILLVACGGAPEATKAPDALYTEVAGTMQAAATQTAQAMPSATITPTFAPTATSTFIPSPTLDVIGTQTVTLTQSGFPTAYVPPAAGQQTGDHAAFGSQSPIDGTTVAAGSEFQIHWFIRNIGTTTWTKDYYLKFLGGTQLWGVTKVNVTKDVVPGKGFDVYVDAFAPVTPGEYINRWAFYTGGGQFLLEVYLHFFVK